MNESHGDVIDALLGHIRVMPVVVIDDADHAIPLADALLEGGINAMEVTLRTPAALAAVEAVAKARPEMVVGTGTILSPTDIGASHDAGAKFLVSPGLTEALAKGARLWDGGPCPLLPGTASASDVMKAMEYGFERVKFFPAVPAGGAPMLKALAGPLPQVKFCPTGGISAQTAPDFLSLKNVFCIGGSWITPKEAMAEGNWSLITTLAKEAAAL